MENTEIVIIDGQEYPVDSSGAKPEKYGDCICWRLNDQYHRVDGPAIINYDGSEEWYQNNHWHNLKGPAIIYSDGDQYWYINGKCIGRSYQGFTQENFECCLSILDKE